MSYDTAKAKELVVQLLSLINEDPSRVGLLETPDRVSRALRSLFSGYFHEPEYLDSLFKVFPSDNKSMIIQEGIPVYSFCEHHMLPFFGTCNIGYVPEGKVIGASKLSRIVDYFSRRLQIQEELTRQIADAISEHLGCQGVMVVMKCTHLCMVYRGVQVRHVPLTTSAVRGCFDVDEKTRHEFLSITQKVPDLL
jgi:GTP cyclohydrolase I